MGGSCRRCFAFTLIAIRSFHHGLLGGSGNLHRAEREARRASGRSSQSWAKSWQRSTKAERVARPIRVEVASRGTPS